MKCLLLLFVIFSFLIFSSAVFCEERKISVYNTYLHPPIVNSDGGGLARTLVDYLNASAKNDIHFVLKNIPRQRLLKYYLSKEENFSEMAIFLSPSFIDDKNKKRFLWSPALFPDYNVLVFGQKKSLNLKRLSDLKGMRFSSVRGYRYYKLDDMLLAGTISKQEANDEETSLRQVLIGRADFTQMNRLFFASLSEREEFKKDYFNALKVPEEPIFNRHILYGKSLHPDVIKKVNQMIEMLPCDKKWKELAKRYEFNAGLCSQGQ